MWHLWRLRTPRYRCATCTQLGHLADDCPIRIAHLVQVCRVRYLDALPDPYDTRALERDVHIAYHSKVHGANYCNYNPVIHGPADPSLPVAPHRALYVQFENVNWAGVPQNC